MFWGSAYTEIIQSIPRNIFAEFFGWLEKIKKTEKLKKSFKNWTHLHKNVQSGGETAFGLVFGLGLKSRMGFKGWD